MENQINRKRLIWLCLRHFGVPAAYVRICVILVTITWPSSERWRSTHLHKFWSPCTLWISTSIHHFKAYTTQTTGIPVIVDTIKYDGKTKPPIWAKRAAGRPKVKRHRRRSELLDASQSRIKCSLCGARGHNHRTCSAPKIATLEQLSL